MSQPEDPVLSDSGCISPYLIRYKAHDLLVEQESKQEVEDAVYRQATCASDVPYSILEAIRI